MEKIQFDPRDQTNSTKTKALNVVEDTLSLKVEVISKHNFQRDMSPEHLALKDETTYMIGGDDYGYLLIKDKKEIYSHKPSRLESVDGLVYVAHLDCFILLKSNKIYRKGIDDQAPQLLLDLGFIKERIFELRYSSLNKRLIIPTNSKLLIIDVVQKRVEFTVPRSKIESVFDLILFGKKQNQLILITDRGSISLFIINFEMKKLIALHHQKIELLKERSEGVACLGVSDDNKFVMVEIEKEEGDLSCSSRMIIFELKNHVLEMKSLLDVFSRKMMACCALSSFWSDDSHVWWIGMEFGLAAAAAEKAKIYDYDVERRILREIEKMRVNHCSDLFFNMNRIGNSFYYPSSEGQIMRLSVIF